MSERPRGNPLKLPDNLAPEPIRPVSSSNGTSAAHAAPRPAAPKPARTAAPAGAASLGVIEPPRPAPALAERVKALALEHGQARAARGGRGSVLPWLLCLAFMGAAGYLAFQQYGSWAIKVFWPGADRDRPFAITTVTATEPESTAPVLEVAGYIVPEITVQVSPKVAGLVQTLYIFEGKVVKKGDLLAKLEDVQYRSDLHKARAGLVQAEANLRQSKAQLAELEVALPETIRQARAALDDARAQQEIAELNYRRNAKLRADRAISASEFDVTRTTLDSATAKARQMTSALKLIEAGPWQEKINAAAAAVKLNEAAVAQARAVLDGAEYQFSNTSIIAPEDGTILSKKAEQGEIVQPQSFGTGGLSASLCTMANLQRLEAEVDVIERDLGKLRVGQPCSIVVDAVPDRTFAGRVHRFLPMANRQRSIVTAKVTVLEPEGLLKPEMSCRVSFLREPPRPGTGSKLYVSRDAVQGQGSEAAVFLVDRGRARRLPVQLGQPVGDSVEVLSGLRLGDPVLIPGDRPVHDGDPVQTKP